MQDRLLGTYSGTVEDASDPLQLGRLKVRCPVVYGSANQPSNGSANQPSNGSANQPSNSVPTSDLPWALPTGLPAGGTNSSGMIAWLPAVGDHVNVRFLDGEPEKPLWEWGMQDTTQSGQTGVWTRQPGGYDPSTNAPPQSAILTRYGHSIDFQPDFIMLRSASGYKIRLTESSQRLDILAPNGKILVRNLVVGGTDVQLNPGNSLAVNTTEFTVSASDSAVISAVTSILSGAMSAQVQAPIVQLGPTENATDPVVRLSDLGSICTILLLWLNTHVHISSSPGHPTSPPITPIVLAPTGSSSTYSA